MTRRRWLWTAVLALPFTVAGGLGGLIYANSQRTTYTCPVNGEQLPCEKCCQLNGEPFICPVTGEELPCPLCCPLNGQQ